MTAEMIMVSTWVTDSLFVWILLELMELGLYFYLILGILPGIKNMGKIDKIILRTVFWAMAVLIGIKYRIGTTFSHLSFSYNLLVLILGTGAAVRENFLLIAGIAVTYTSSILLLRYILLFVMCLAAYGTESPLSRLAFAGGHGNTAFAVTHLGVLLLVFLILYRIRNSGISRQIRAYRNLLLLVGIVLSALALEYQNLLEYGFQYLPAGIPAVNSILRDSLLSLLTSVALGAAAGVLFLKNRSIRTENNLLLMKEEMERQKYEEIRSAVEKNREMVHDTKNHYLVICEYIQNEKYDCLKNYVADIQKNFERTDSWAYTGNYILDLILGQKKTLAREKGIKNFEISTEIRRSVFHFRFFLGICLLVCAFLTAAYPFRASLIESGGSREGPSWIAVFIYSISSGVGLMCFPLTVPLAAAEKAQEELKNRYTIFLIPRAGRKRYIAGKAAGAAAAGGIMAAAALGIALLIICFWCKGIPDLSGCQAVNALSAESGVYGGGQPPVLAPVNLIPGFICGFLNGAFWGIASSAASVLTRKQYLGYAVPFVLYYVLTVFQERYYEDLYFLSPRQWAYPSHYSAGVCVVILLFMGAAASLLLAMLIGRRMSG